MTTKTMRLGVILLGALLALTSMATAQDRTTDDPLGELACNPALDMMPATRYLRALSLDLRGTVPTVAEVSEVEAAGTVDSAIVDDWLDSPEFVTQAVRFHEKLLWNNVDNINLMAANVRLARTNPEQLHWIRGRAMRYRGVTAPCRNEPAEFRGTNGTEIVTDENGVEGYVEVVPYWSVDGQPIKVCAFDAQPHMVSESGTVCARRQGSNDTGCGCGEDLRWCAFGGEHRAVNRAMRTALGRFIGSVFDKNEPYSKLFTSRRGFVNGPLAYFWRHHTGTPAGLVYEPKPLDVELLPELPFTAYDDWHEIELPQHHAGILTRTSFLLRFQTNRARANRFYDAFLCDPFNPPDGGLPVADEESARNPDLQHRAGCKYCHSLLEPAASHWGRWSEQGIGYLSADAFPKVRSDCEACALRGQSCSAECRNFYTTQSFSDAEDDYLGMLRAYQFRREDHEQNIEVGPRLLALTTITDNRMPRCVAKRTAEWLLGRPMVDVEDITWIDEIARQFVFADLNYKSLVKAIV
ncbi:MAG: hypothetical protein VX589_06595, partial [Myxococcota bacterium]|nr:hypothetical protein [Myxococcota bacterium]